MSDRKETLETIDGVIIARNDVRTCFQLFHEGREVVIYMPSPEQPWEGRAAYEFLANQALELVDALRGVTVVEFEPFGLFMTAAWEPGSLNVFICLSVEQAEQVAMVCGDEIAARTGRAFRVVRPEPTAVEPSPTSWATDAASDEVLH